jgi:hypothetical protein
VHTSVVELVKVTGSSELAVAARVGDVPKSWLPGFSKVMVCVPFGVTEADATEAGLVPTLLVAVTVKV